MRKRPTSKAIVLMVSLVAVLALAACGGGAPSPAVELRLAPLSQLPQAVRKAPLSVRQAYQFAVANPEILEKFPCYCGCGAVGHQSNLNCYIRSINPDGSIVFDDHAFG